MTLVKINFNSDTTKKNLEAVSNLILVFREILQNEVTKLIQTWDEKEDWKYANTFLH